MKPKTMEAGVRPAVEPDEMKALMPKAISGQASAAELARFGALWQDRVRKMVVEHAADTAMVQVSDLNVA